MIIEELKNQKVKCSANSITCKDENGKTKGVVRNATKFQDLPLRYQHDCIKDISAAGLWGSGEMKNVYIVDGKIYFLLNLKTFESYEKYFSKIPGYEREKENCERLKRIAEKAAEVVTVIPCYIS